MAKSFEQISKNLFLFRDICNVYVVKDRTRGILIDSGSGAVLDHLDEIGVKRIEWVLHTHHHRDQCWGTKRAVETGARVSVPEYERFLFDRAEEYWRVKRIYDNYNDRNTFFSVGEDISVDATLDDYEEFQWGKYSFYVLPAKGHTQGQSCLIAEIDGNVVAFTGDLMQKGGKLYQLHAMEYGYGSAIGIPFTLQSIYALSKEGPDICLPSHGDPIEEPDADIHFLSERLYRFLRLGPGAAGLTNPEEIVEPPYIQVSPHLLWSGPFTCSNFYVIKSESGKACFIDYGHSLFSHMHFQADEEPMEDMRFIAHHLDELFEHHGIQKIDLVIPTHIHDDHTCGIPFLQRYHKAKCWALQEVAQVIEDPARWCSTPCTLSKPILVHKKFEDGDTFQWEEYEFKIHHAPGQTEFHSVIGVTIDDQRVAFTGDNYFLHEVQVHGSKKETRPFQTTVMRNSFSLGMHRKCREVMLAENPTVICPGHRDVMLCDPVTIQKYCHFIDLKEQASRDLVDEPAEHYVDLFWARMLPYLRTVRPGSEVEWTLLIRNNFEKSKRYRAILHLPDGWRRNGKSGVLRLKPGARGEISLMATAPTEGDGFRRLITAEVEIDGTSQGPIAESLVTVE